MTNQNVKQMSTDAQGVTPAHATIAGALASAQLEMGKAVKDTQNPHFRTKYADLGAVMDACLPALNRHGIAVIQTITNGDAGREMVTRFIHEGGQVLECPVPLLLGKQDMQGLGSAMTYARRYGLMALAGIAPEDDDGNAAVASGPAKQDRPARVQSIDADAVQIAVTSLGNAETLEALQAIWIDLAPAVRTEAEAAKNARKAALQSKPSDSVTADEIPY